MSALSRSIFQVVLRKRAYFPLQKLSEYLEGLKCKFDSILAISPTGWTHSNKTVGLDKIRPKLRRGNIIVYGESVRNI